MAIFIALLCYLFLFSAIILAVLCFGFKHITLKKWLYISLSGLIAAFVIYQFIPTTAPKSDKLAFNDVIKLKSKKSDTGGFDAPKDGHFILKGVALKNTKIILKDDLDEDYPVTTKKLKAGQSFQIPLYVKDGDSVNINLHAKYKKQDLEKDIDVWSTSDNTSSKRKSSESKDSSTSTSPEKISSKKSSTKQKSSKSKNISQESTKQGSIKHKKANPNEKYNKQIANEVKLYQGWAAGLLDDDGNPTQDGEPQDQFSFSTPIDKITYNKKQERVNVYLHSGLVNNLSKSEKKEFGHELIKGVQAIISEVDEDADIDMLDIKILNTHGRDMGRQQIMNPTQISWY